MKKHYSIANWKIYMNEKNILKFLKEFSNYEKVNYNGEVVFCPSYLHMNILNKYPEFNLGSQNVSKYKKGAYTGEISINYLEEINAKYCIVGHSERRTLMKESDCDIREKFINIYKSNIIPILCIGESEYDRKNNNFKNILEEQLFSVFNNFDQLDKEILIAYEPIWAIGTGMSANVSIIEETHNIIVKILKKLGLNNSNIYLLYGGSVDEKNANSIIEINNVDGFLVGSASTQPNIFHKICSCL